MANRFLKNGFLIFSFLVTTLCASSQSPSLVVPVNDTRDVQCMDISSDGSLIATGHLNNRVVIWDARTGRELKYYYTAGGVHFVRFSPDASYLISGSSPAFGNYFAGDIIYKWDVNTGKLIQTMPFTASSNFLISGNGNYYLTYNLNTDNKISALFVPFDIMNTLTGVNNYYVWDALKNKVAAVGVENKNSNSFFIDYKNTPAIASINNGGLIGKGNAQIEFFSLELLAKYYTPGSKNSAKDNKKEEESLEDKAKNFFKHKLGKATNIDPLKSDNDKAIIGTIKLKYKADKIYNCYDNQFVACQSGTNKIEVLDINASKVKTSIEIPGTLEKIMVQSAAGRIITICRSNNKIVITNFDLNNGSKVSENGVESTESDLVNLAPNAQYLTAKGKEGVSLYSLYGNEQTQLIAHSTPINTMGIANDSRYVLTRPISSEKKMREDSIKIDSILWYQSAIMFQTRTNDYSMNFSEASKKEIRIETDKMHALFRETRIKMEKDKGWDKIGPYHWDINKANVLLKDALKYPYFEDSTAINKRFNLTHDFYNNDAALMFMSMSSVFDTKGGDNDDDSANQFPLLKYFMSANGPMARFYEKEARYLSYSTLIFHNYKNNRRVKLIPLDTEDYVLLLDNGYFMGSKNSKRRIYYVLNKKTISFDQLDARYNRPDMVLAALGGDQATVMAYNNAYKKRVQKLQIDTTQFKEGLNVPEADFINKDAIAYEQSSNQLTLQFSGSSKTSALDRYNVWINDIPLFGKNGTSVKEKNQKEISNIAIPVVLSEGINRIEVSVTNREGLESLRSPLFIKHKPAVPATPKTYFIGFGTEQFSQPQYNLQYSVKDIRDLSKRLQDKLGNSLEVDTFFNKGFTIESIKKVRQKLLKMDVNDKVIIAYSGHGLLSSKYDYFLSTYATDFTKPELNGMPYEELENLLDGIPPRKKLLLIDACHSGEVDKNDIRISDSIATKNNLAKGIKPIAANPQAKHIGLRNSFELMQDLFVNVDKNTGATIIAAAAGTQFALERGDLKNGVFTYCILEMMQKNQHASVGQLKQYVNSRVPELTSGAQQPTTRNENIQEDWDVW